MFKLKDYRQSMCGIISDAFALFKGTWAPSILVSFVAVVIAVIISYFIGYQQIISAVLEVSVKNGHAHASAIKNYDFYITALKDPLHTVTLFTMLSFLVLWIFKISNAILVKMNHNFALTGKIEFKNAFVVGIKYFYVYLLLMVIMYGICMFTHSLQYTTSILNSSIVNAIIAVATHLFMYWLVIKLMMVEAAAVIDNAGMHGFCKSWVYSKHNWFKIFTSFVLTSFFYIMVVFLVGVGIFWFVFSAGVNPFFASPKAYMHAEWYRDWFGIAIMFFTSITGAFTLLSFPNIMACLQTVLYKDISIKE